MYQVESEITGKNIERAKQHDELERRQEIESKLIPKTSPELFESIYKEAAYPVEQIYLSSPLEEFSLRVRCAQKPTGVEYSATLKDRGEHCDEDRALRRTEITTPLSRSAYLRFAESDAPRIQKKRFDLSEAVSIDFFESDETPVVIEVEHGDPEVRSALVQNIQDATHIELVDYSNEPGTLNETMAYAAYETTPSTPESLDAFSENIVRTMIAHYVTGKKQVVVGISGMSGSGKSTVTEFVKQRITELYGSDFTPISLSTDDYHFGKHYLEAQYGAPYADWDDPQTYNTAELARDIGRLAEGQSVSRRRFDFETQEPQILEPLRPSPFVIVEGLYAGSQDLSNARALHYTLPTGVATSIGRDLRRLVLDNRGGDAFPTPESRLRYQLEVALPLYEQQEHAQSNNRLLGCARPLAERAMMLSKLH